MTERDRPGNGYPISDAALFTVAVKKELSAKRVSGLLCTAFEGGSNYWYLIEDFENPDNVPVEFRHVELPFVGGAVLVSVPDDGDGKVYRLDRAAVERGLAVMAEKYPRHLLDFIEENDDADTGDVFLQCALFGEVIYG